MKRTNKRYGWRPDLPDFRDLPYVPMAMAKMLPKVTNNRMTACPIYDQGEAGSCTGNSSAWMFRYVERKQTLKDFEPSRLFAYYNGRSEEGSEDSDSGAMLRDVIHSIKTDGICSEQSWPYDVGMVTERPEQSCYEEAIKHQSLKYRRIAPTMHGMRSCLASGFPFVFGFTVYESFESEHVRRTGIVPMPARGEEALGGHAVVGLDYDDSKKAVLVVNSWGLKWGQAGMFWMPYDYISNPDLADDRWCITLLEAP